MNGEHRRNKGRHRSNEERIQEEYKGIIGGTQVE